MAMQVGVSRRGRERQKGGWTVGEGEEAGASSRRSGDKKGKSAGDSPQQHLSVTRSARRDASGDSCVTRIGRLIDSRGTRNGLQREDLLLLLAAIAAAAASPAAAAAFGEEDEDEGGRRTRFPRLRSVVVVVTHNSAVGVMCLSAPLLAWPSSSPSLLLLLMLLSSLTT